MTGRSVEHGGAGDSSVLTAFGVYQGMLAAARHCWDVDALAGRRIGIAGVGKVGKHLADLAAADGADLVVTDVDPAAVDWVHRHHPDATVVDDAGAFVGEDIDIYAPCALGHAIDDDVTAVLRRVDGVRRRQQPARPRSHRQPSGRARIVFCPDYLVNAGGVIQVADELHGFSFERAKAKAARDLRRHAGRVAPRPNGERDAGRGRRPAGRATHGERRARRPDLGRALARNGSAKPAPPDTARGVSMNEFNAVPPPLSRSVLLTGAGCADDSAADRACDAREDLTDAVDDVATDVQEANFGDARNGLDDVRDAYNRLRDAVTDLAAEQRDELRPETDDLAADVAALPEAQDLEELGSMLETTLTDAQDVLDDVTTTPSCP